MSGAQPARARLRPDLRNRRRVPPRRQRTAAPAPPGTRLNAGPSPPPGAPTAASPGVGGPPLQGSGGEKNPKSPARDATPSRGAGVPRCPAGIRGTCPTKARASHVPEPPSAAPAARLSPAAPSGSRFGPAPPAATGNPYFRVRRLLAPLRLPSGTRTPPSVGSVLCAFRARGVVPDNADLLAVRILSRRGEAIMTILIITMIMNKLDDMHENLHAVNNYNHESDTCVYSRLPSVL